LAVDQGDGSATGPRLDSSARRSSCIERATASFPCPTVVISQSASPGRGWRSSTETPTRLSGETRDGGLVIEEFLTGHHRPGSRPRGCSPPSCSPTSSIQPPARAALGDRAWRQVLDRHDTISSSTVSECDGRVVKGTGDGMLATFDAPARGLRCADTLRSSLSDVGITIRAGVHTGEIELRGDDVSGIGVHIAARVAALAGSGELLASRTVKDLVAGSGYAFTSRGVHSLKGVPDEWELLAVS